MMSSPGNAADMLTNINILYDNCPTTQFSNEAAARKKKTEKLGAFEM